MNYPLLQLDEDGVVELLATLGYPYYESQLKDNGINGEVLVHLDHELLREIGIASVGQRIAILKAVYALKVQQNVPVEEGHYIPPCKSNHTILSGFSLISEISTKLTHP